MIRELVMTLQSVIEFIGTFAFALSGIRLAASKHYDWLGGFVVAWLLPLVAEPSVM